VQADLEPFRHHPFLRNEIVDPLRSNMRNYTTAVLAKKMAALLLRCHRTVIRAVAISFKT
jgi:hypothetical protein